MLLPNLTCLLSAAYENPIKPLNTHPQLLPQSSTKFLHSMFFSSPESQKVQWSVAAPLIMFHDSSPRTQMELEIERFMGEKVPGKDNGERAQEVAGKMLPVVM